MEGGTFTVYFDAAHPTSINLPRVPNDAQDYVTETGVLPNSVGSFHSYELPLDWKR